MIQLILVTQWNERNYEYSHLGYDSINRTVPLTLSARPPFQNFSTPCILNVNNTGAKHGSIMK
jgi:hypothetical protein